MLRRSFVFREGKRDQLLGHRLPEASDFAAFVANTLYQAKVEENLLAWVCPVQFEYPQVHEELGFPAMVADVIDNHFSWELSPARAEQVRENYNFILPRANVAFANCEAVRQQMAPLNPNIHLIPNGLELQDPDQKWPEPAALQNLPRPLIGYVGNLSSRLRIPLLERIAREHPEWTLVLIGSAHLSRDILALRKYPNVHFLGVVPYEQVKGYIAQFDVALIPHEVNAMTDSMNPLKCYVYASLGVPIVSTQIANLEDLGTSIHVASDDDAFLAAISTALQQRPELPKDRILSACWQNRVNAMMERVLDSL